MTENVKVQVACCPTCGNVWLMSATETTFDRSTTREFAKMMEKGFIVRPSTLEEARSSEMYCDCKSIAQQAINNKKEGE